MKPGIKPSHLWHWTPRKWFESVLKDRLSIKNIDQRDKNELLKTNFIVMSISLLLMYSYGIIDPKETITRMINERSCATAAQSVEPEPEPVRELPPEPENVCPPKKKKELPKCP